MLERIRIVLVRPIRSGNIGAVSRAMANLGLTDLVLVAPACDHRDAQAVGFAARARPLLERARVVATLPEALSDCVQTFATSAKGGFYRRRVAVDAAEGACLALQAARRGTVAVAFGPEDRGLVLEDLLSFDRVLEIPANPAYPALNLAAAATIVCYELRKAAVSRLEDEAALGGSGVEGGGAGDLDASRIPPATDAQKRVMYEKLFESLERIGFFRNQQYENHLQMALRHMLGRLDLSRNEADILVGLARQIGWYVDHSQPMSGRSQ